MRIELVVEFFLWCLVARCHSTRATLCTPNVDITDGVKFGDHIIKDDVRYEPGHYFHDDGKIYGCICDVKVCVRKCCPLGTSLQQRTCLPLEEEFDFVAEVQNHTIADASSFHIIDGLVDCGSKSRFKLNSNYDQFTITPKGMLYWYEEFDHMNYCLDYCGTSKKFSVVLCSDETSNNVTHYSIGMIISMPFLLATFLVYALLPDRNLPAKALMCYVLSLLFAYIMLVTIQLNGNLQLGACNTIAFLCYFFFMASFFWMNASCIDIWLTFSGIKGITGQRTQERKRFFYYCLYSWGLPLLMTVVVVVITLHPVSNPKVDTGIGIGQCWFQQGLPTGIYFYFPIAALLITNIALFIVTALKIRNVQRDTKMLNAKDSSKHEKDKQRFDVYSDEAYLTDAVKNRGIEVYDFLDEDNSCCIGFNLYVKLLFAMGINWSMEVISWAVLWQLHDIPSWIWYITDFCNAMYGVLIFFIFVFKRNIWLMLKKRYLQFTGRPTQAHSLGTSTHRTTVSQVTSSEA